MIIDIKLLGKQDNITTHPTLAKCFEAGAQFLNHASKLLEIGPGIRPIVLQFPPNLRVLVEPSSEYCGVLSRILGPRENTVVINQDAINFLESLPDSSFDAIVLTDVLEHLDKADGMRLISELERVSSSIVGIFTPLGFMPQHFSSSLDSWGFTEVELQTHRSGWLPNDFGDQWKFQIAQRAHVSDDGEEFGAMWATYKKEIINEHDKTIVFTPGYESDRDSAIFKLSHSKDSIEIISNGYTRLLSEKSNVVEFGSNTYFEGVNLKHTTNSILKLSIYSYLKLLHFRISRLSRKKELNFFNLDRFDKIILKQRKKK